MFYEEKKLNNELNCLNCNLRLDEPRILPCGEFICAYCYMLIEVNINKFKCFLCKEDHLMPEEGFLINKRLLRILSIKSEEVYRSKEVKQLKENLNVIQEDINKFSFGIDNPVDKIKGLCLDLKNKVQLKTEEAIEQLNEHNKKIITEIEDYERECIKSYQVKEKANIEFIKTKQELEEFNLKWNEYLKQTVIYDEDVSVAIAKSNELCIKSEKELAKLEELIFNGCEIKFEKNENKLDRSVLGSLAKHPVINQLAILTNEQMTELMSLCKFSLNQKWKLIYRATRDGFGAADFHSKCDSYQKSLVIIKSTNGNVFGGYTEQNWYGIPKKAKIDQNAFLFSFINKHNTKVFMKCKDPLNAIYAFNEYGPIFGGPCDLNICSNSNKINGSSSDLDWSYNFPNYANGSNEAKSFLAGSYNFLTTEIEVYTKS